MPNRIVLATRNEHKVGELLAILGDVVAELDLEVVGLSAYPDLPDVVEDGVTFAANATKKAAAVADALGLPALADDSGLEVDALEGRPGVRSARYAGEDATDADNVEKLLAELGRVGVVDRTARFRCVIVLRWPDGREVVADGTCEGRIGAVPAGVGGFGYDPVFVPDDGDGRTFAEMSGDEKHAISHRGRAIAKLVSLLAVTAP